MRKLSVILLLLVFATLLLTGCNQNTINGNGTIIETIIPITGRIEAITNTNIFHVVLTDRQDNISLVADENLVPYISIEQSGVNLQLRRTGNHQLNPTTPIIIRVPISYVTSVSVSGSGRITSEVPLDVDSFAVNISGSGNITLEGRVVNLTVAVPGSGDAILQNIQADNVTATLSGSGDISLTAIYGLNATVSGSGTIDYFGNPPNLITNTTGSGSIREN